MNRLSNTSENEALLKLTSELASLGSWEWNYREGKVYLSEELFKLLGVSKKGQENFNGDFECFVEKYIHPDYKKTVIRRARHAIKSGKTKPIEYKVITESGEERWVRTIGKSLFDSENKPVKMIGTLQDITERKNTEFLLAKHYEFLQTIIDAIPNPVFYKDIHGFYKYCNTAFAELLGLKPEQIIGHTIYDITCKNIADGSHKEDLEVIKELKQRTYEAKVKYSDQTIHDTLITKGVALNKDGSLNGIVGNLVDISEQKKAEQNIYTLLKQKESVIEISRAILEMNDIKMLLEFSLDKVIEFMEHKENLGCILILNDEDNLTITASRGYDSSASQDFILPLKSSYFWDLSKGDLNKPVVINNIQELTSQKFPATLGQEGGIKIESSISIPILLNKKLYGIINIDSTFNNNFADYDLSTLEYVRNQIEIGITKQKLYEETLTLSRFDKLTNLFNRRYFEELLEQQLERASRYKETFFLVSIDIDNLKQINDRYGHSAGDEMIQFISSRINSKIRSSDLFSRYGGDEFAAVFLNTDSQELIEKLEGIRGDILKEPLSVNAHSVFCSFSYGIAGFPTDGSNYSELMKKADSQMYNYKNTHKMDDIPYG